MVVSTVVAVVVTATGGGGGSSGNQCVIELTLTCLKVYTQQRDVIGVHICIVPFHYNKSCNV